MKTTEVFAETVIELTIAVLHIKDSATSVTRRYVKHQDGQHDQRNIPNVRHYMCSICSIQGHYDQPCHVAMHYFQDLATLFGVNIPQQASVNTHIAQTTEQLTIKQTGPNSKDSQYFRTRVL